MFYLGQFTAGLGQQSMAKSWIPKNIDNLEIEKIDNKPYPRFHKISQKESSKGLFSQ